MERKKIDENSIIAARLYFFGENVSGDVNRVSKILWWNWLIKDIKLTACYGVMVVVGRWFCWWRNDDDTYTSTKTGKAASRNSSRHDGGYKIWTWIRVPWFSVISNECFFGSASLSRRCFNDEFAILNSSCNNIFVLIECTPAKQIRNRQENNWSN